MIAAALARVRACLRKAPLVITSAILAACATATHDVLSTESITDGQGHVVGRTELVREKATGERRENRIYYTPRYDVRGTVVAYDELVPDGVVVRTPEGKRVGVRYHDLRSRGTNPSNDGIGIMFERRVD